MTNCPVCGGEFDQPERGRPKLYCSRACQVKALNGQGNRHVKHYQLTGVRLAPELKERLWAAANDRDVSMNWLVNRAIVEFLDRLIPADEFKLTRD